MATTAAQAPLPASLSLDPYRIDGGERILTPALAIYPQIVDANIRATIGLLGSPDRWRPHIKTAKLASVMRELVRHGVTNFKCSTTLELATVCEAGAADVLVAYPMVGAGALRVRELRDRYPAVSVSALVENREQIEAWEGSDTGLFIDVNPGMDRTGIGEERIEEIIAVARAIGGSGLAFRGLHYYDGHLSGYDLPERETLAHRGYDHLIKIVTALQDSGIALQEVITAGTPAFPCTLSYKPFNDAPFVHRASPGTVVYGDCMSLAQLPEEYGYRPAAIVISTVVSNPRAGRLTCDAGHKTVSADAGAPTCAVIARPDLLPLRPSEEHLPIEASGALPAPGIGDQLYLVPRHICPTVNNFDHAIIVREGRALAVERVTARGREAPLIGYRGRVPGSR